MLKGLFGAILIYSSQLLYRIAIGSDNSFKYLKGRHSTLPTVLCGIWTAFLVIFLMILAVSFGEGLLTVIIVLISEIILILLSAWGLIKLIRKTYEKDKNEEFRLERSKIASRMKAKTLAYTDKLGIDKEKSIQIAREEESYILSLDEKMINQFYLDETTSELSVKNDISRILKTM